MAFKKLMHSMKKSLIFLLCTIFFLMDMPTLYAQKTPTGIEDRAYWCNLLYKIAYPVVNNLSEGTLKKNMPLETGPGYSLKVEKVTYAEAVGRTLVGIAPWLTLPDDETKEGMMRKQIRTASLKGLANAFDSSNADFLNFSTEQQPIVDAAFLAQAFLRAPKQLWDPLDSTTKNHIILAFKSLRNRKPGYNNWLLFSGITESFLLKIGEQADPMRIDFAFRKMKEWYVGDGWYKDGEIFSMDYYNSFVIHSMLVDMLGLMVEKKMAKQEDYDLALKRMVRYSVSQERMISPEGTFPIMGRSMTYRIGAFQALAQVSLMEKLPQPIEPAQVRSAFTAMMHRIFDVKETFDDKGWLQLGLAGHQPSIADTYTSTGSLYLCTTGFLALGLPVTNIFWTAPNADWTSKKGWNGQSIKKDYKVEY